MTITWNLPQIGDVHQVVPESEVMERMEALTKLGLNPTFTLDNPNEK